MARSSWSGDFFDYTVGTVQKENKIDKLDQGKITDGRIAAYRLIIQPQLEARTKSGVVPAHCRKPHSASAEVILVFLGPVFCHILRQRQQAGNILTGREMQIVRSNVRRVASTMNSPMDLNTER